MSSRLLALRRTLVVCTALFAVLLTFLALQMLRGRDPAVPAAQARAAAPVTAPTADDGSLISSIVGFAASVITEGDDDGEHDDGGSSMRTQTS